MGPLYNPLYNPVKSLDYSSHDDKANKCPQAWSGKSLLPRLWIAVRCKEAARPVTRINSKPSNCDVSTICCWKKFDERILIGVT